MALSVQCMVNTRCDCPCNDRRNDFSVLDDTVYSPHKFTQFMLDTSISIMLLSHTHALRHYCPPRADKPDVTRSITQKTLSPDLSHCTIFIAPPTGHVPSREEAGAP